MLLGVLLCALMVALAQNEECPSGSQCRLVRTAQGPVRGRRTADGELFAFYSIPYATAPTGTDRFKAPLPGPVWMTPFEAVDNGIICPQILFANVTDNKNMREDCLIANIYVPDTEETNLPVVVYVHGGSYQMGYGQWVKPTNLAKSKKLIAVTFNYRLGVHGFLCLGTEGAPGNAGMKDQVALLHWVNRNIASFGGNPDDVTIAGYSAGSSSVDLLQLSKSTTGLFNKVIPESGANIAGWSVQANPLETAKNFARKHNFTNVDDVYALEEFFKSTSLQQLISGALFSNRPDFGSLFTPCVERDVGVETFLEYAPIDILKEGKHNKFPMLYGFTSMEGISCTYFGLFDVWKDYMNENFAEFLSADLQFESQEQRAEVAKDIKEFYFGIKPVSEETVTAYIDYFTDILYAYPALRSSKLQVESGNNKIFLYEYSFSDIEVPSPFPTKFHVLGADHCSQTTAVLDGVFTLDGVVEENLPERFRKMKAVTRELWINFITTGVPVPAGSSLPEWPAAGANGAPHMSLDDPLRLRGTPLERRVRFWDDIYERHYLKPSPPPTPPLRIRTEL